MIGQTIGHYRILDKLGEGGMGVVYLAEDTTLDRKVALKVLPEELAGSQERLERFEREAKTLAALDHPNIVTIHTVEEADGVRFLTMQRVEGQRLSELIPAGGMPLERIFDIAIPLADALAAAHEKGVIHRDLKPANIMVAADGRVKVLDFGLAKLRHDQARQDFTALPTEPLTAQGLVLGTVPYMSPEQLEGGQVDPRTDIFSLGVVLYEMATGERPFQGESSASLISSILTTSPRAVDALRDDLPHHLGRIVSHCLEKDPRRRYQSAIDVHNELDALRKEVESDVTVRPSETSVPTATPTPRSRRWWPAVAGIAIAVLAAGGLWLGLRDEPAPGSGPTPVGEAEEPMIAVLPFENLGSPEDEYFADGMTEEITSRLAMVGGLGVISRTSAMQYKENRPPLQQIGEELGVDYVLEGTVRWAKSPDGPGRVRITPQLIRVVDDRHVWADNIERQLEDIFAVQAEIAQQVIAQMGVTLGASEKTALEERPTDSLAAYEAYLRGLEARDAFRHKEAARLFERAVEEDPRYADAHARLAETYARLHAWGDLSEDWSRRSERALERARELAPEDLEVRQAAAIYDYYVEEDFPGALAAFTQLSEKYPKNTELLKNVAYVSRRLGRWQESNQAFERVIQIDPRDSLALEQLAGNLRFQWRWQEAEAMYDRCIGVGPLRDRCFAHKGWVRFGATGDTAAAREIALQSPAGGEDQDYLLLRMDYFDRDRAATFERLGEFARAETDEWFLQRNNASMPYAFGEVDRARSAARELVPVFERLVEQQPKNFKDLAVLGTLYAILGEDELALATGERAMELGRHDLYEVNWTWHTMAETCLILGEHERAIDLLDRVLATPGWGRPSIHWYRRDPLWDPVRDNPRFQAVLQKYEQAAG